MNAQSVPLNILIGPKVPVPAPQMLTEAVQRIEVTHADQGRSGFQLQLLDTRVLARNFLPHILQFRLRLSRRITVSDSRAHERDETVESRKKAA